MTSCRTLDRTGLQRRQARGQRQKRADSRSFGDWSKSFAGRERRCSGIDEDMKWMVIRAAEAKGMAIRAKLPQTDAAAGLDFCS